MKCLKSANENSDQEILNSSIHKKMIEAQNRQLNVHLFRVFSVLARVFPGDLRLNRTFQPEMADQSSQQFRDTAGSIIRSVGVYCMSL